MTYLFNKPEEFTTDALRGLVKAHPGRLRQVPGGIARAEGTRPGKVAVVVGGGSGHYPAFAGVVGQGLADAAVCGEVFTSPSTRQVLGVCRAADAGAGVWVSTGSYAGDVLHFGAAASRLRTEGIDVVYKTVTDDIASAPVERKHERRGVAGDLMVFKIAGAAAERGDDLAEVSRLADLANDRTQSFGVAFDGCTLPGAEKPLFTVPEGRAGWGLGIHGEPGIGEAELPTAADLARKMVDEVLAERPEGAERAAVMLNGLGTVKYEELFIVWDTVSDLLAERGVTVVAPLVGEYVTSLDMAGASLTVLWLTEELEPLWLAPADCPGFQHGSWRAAPETAAPEAVDEPPSILVEASGPVATGIAQTVATAIEAAQRLLHEKREWLGDLDAIAGDGDHGIGMCRGIDAAAEAAQAALAAHGDGPSVLRRAANAWSDRAGGTSGALWGVGLLAFADHLPADRVAGTEDVVAGMRAALDALMTIGGARVGDKTMVDALHPFTETLEAETAAGAELAEAWADAVVAAQQAAAGTAGFASRRGRSRPLGEKSIGTPDPGATSLALILREVGALLGARTPETAEVSP